MACFRGNWDEFYGEVLLLDERKMTLGAEQGFKKSSKAAAILNQVFSHLDVRDVEFFGLRFCDREQQTHWLDPLKTLKQHRDLVGPPFIFYFGVKFYVPDASRLKEENTRLFQRFIKLLFHPFDYYHYCYLYYYYYYQTESREYNFVSRVSRYQFYLQVRQDVRQGRLPCPPPLRPRLSALMLQAERGDRKEAEPEESEENQEVQHIYKSLSGVSRPQAQRLLLSLCSSLQMFGASLFAAYGENQAEYFLGPTTVGVVIYRNKELVGKYYWQRIKKLHFKNKTFELRIVVQNVSSNANAKNEKIKGSHIIYFALLNELYSYYFGPLFESVSNNESICVFVCVCVCRKQLMEPDGLIDRQTEEIPYKDVRVLGEPIRMQRCPRGRVHRRWASASNLHPKMDLVPPLPVTKATATYPQVAEAGVDLFSRLT
ncbi:band 4.1-like protein 4A [Pungitius pungitius]|uniref:band 4.1-like protein 4A n=1 Tax=Pungitius pungitius TaxID=134920 RepID=UPI002E158A8E